MTKKIYLSLIFITAVFLFGALPASALDGVDWGIFEDYTIHPNKYAFNKIFNKEPINYYIFVEDDKKPVERNEEDYEYKYVNELKNISNVLKESLKTEKIYLDFARGIENAFDIWFDDTREMIIKNGRKKEFNDIMPILNKKTRLKRVSDLEKADIVFAFVYDIQAYCPPSAGGCISWKKHINKQPYAFVIVPNPRKNKKDISESSVFHILTHEIGHYFGLTDQYYRQNYNYRSDRKFHNPRIGYRNSTMGASYKIGLDCDDVDGFINLIDLSLSGGNQEKFSARAQTAWASFCNEKNEYFLDMYYRNAQTIKITVADWVKTPFNAYGRILSYDDKGRILTTTDGKTKYIFDYTETEKDNFISAFKGEKEFKIRYGKDIFNILLWSNENWCGHYFVENDVETCGIHYASKIFNIHNGKCFVENLKDKSSDHNTKDDFEIDFEESFIESEAEKENKILQERICPFMQTECSFFKKIYESLK